MGDEPSQGPPPAKASRPKKSLDSAPVAAQPKVRSQTTREVAPAESQAEEQSRLRIAEADARHRRWRETLTHFAVIAGLGYVAYHCSRVSVDPGADPEARKWANSIMLAIVTGAAAWVGGTKAGKAS